MSTYRIARWLPLALVSVALGCSGGPDRVNPDGGGGDGDGGGGGDHTPPVTTASPEAGPIHQGPVTVTLSTDEPAVTRYTLDGSAPDGSSPVASGPIVIDRTLTLRFYSVDLAGNAESPQAARYRIDIVRRLLLEVGAS